MILERPVSEPQVLRVQFLHARRRGVVSRVAVFDAETGVLVREEAGTQ